MFPFVGPPTRVPNLCCSHRLCAHAALSQKNEREKYYATPPPETTNQTHRGFCYTNSATHIEPIFVHPEFVDDAWPSWSTEVVHRVILNWPVYRLWNMLVFVRSRCHR